jgi:H+/gluconate symporter-like permease
VCSSDLKPDLVKFGDKSIPFWRGYIFAEDRKEEEEEEQRKLKEEEEKEGGKKLKDNEESPKNLKTKLNRSAIPTLIPFVNTVYDLIFDSSTPSPESAKALLDIVGLLNALLLASETGLLGSFTFDELEAVDIRFSNSTDGGYGTYW